MKGAIFHVIQSIKSFYLSSRDSQSHTSYTMYIWCTYGNLNHRLCLKLSASLGSVSESSGLDYCLCKLSPVKKKETFFYDNSFAGIKHLNKDKISIQICGWKFAPVLITPSENFISIFAHGKWEWLKRNEISLLFLLFWSNFLTSVSRCSLPLFLDWVCIQITGFHSTPHLFIKSSKAIDVCFQNIIEYYSFKLERLVVSFGLTVL